MKTPKQPVISQDKKDLLNLRRLPARLTVEEAAVVLGCKTYNLPVLEQLGLLRPLAPSKKNHVRHYAAVEVEALARDPNNLRIAEQLWRKLGHDRNDNGRLDAPEGAERRSHAPFHSK